ncbi:MAG: hypothetical protein P1V20_07950 [Verrucomicrobiales bacterium]|nr:hypothetical protein [Verrucomicrobiales bacterium]
MGIVLGDKFLSGLSCVSLLAVAVFVSSCATAKVEMADAYFNGNTISGEKMAVGPVVQIGGEPLRSHEAEAMRNQLTRAITNKRNYITVSHFSGPNIIHRTGGIAEDGISHSIRSAAKQKGIRFLVLTEVTENCVSHDVDKTCEERTEDIVDDCGKIIGHRHQGSTYTTTSRSKRKVAARFKALDLESGKTVWVSRSDSSNTASCSSQSTCCYPTAPPFPAPPSADGIGMTIARAAVRKLPRGGM